MSIFAIMDNKQLPTKSYQVEEEQIGMFEEQLSMKYPVKKQMQENAKKTLNVLSLFSGCGGMDLGFEGGFLVHKKAIGKGVGKHFVSKVIDDNYVKVKATKFKTVFANDILGDAKKSWIHNFSKLGYQPEMFHSESIVNLVKLHEMDAAVFPEKVDVVTGGFPCQDFSVAGKRNGFNSHRNHDGKLLRSDDSTEETRGKLYYWMKKVIEITKPNIFIAENVKGLVNLSNVKEVIQRDFAASDDNGYIVLDPQVLHSADYGVPQSRQRVFFIGIKKSALNKTALLELQKEKIIGAFNPYPPKTHTPKNYTHLADVLNHLKEPEESNDLSQMHYSKAKYMGKHCQGQTEINLGGIGPTIRAEHHGNIEFRRLALENGGKYEKELSNGLIQRRLTVRECAIIQSFPPDFEFVVKSNQKGKKFIVSPSKAYKLIGNAVPPLLAYNLARRIEELWSLYFKKD